MHLRSQLSNQFLIHPNYPRSSALIKTTSRWIDAFPAKVAVLDPSRSFRVGECQVALDDIKPVTRSSFRWELSQDICPEPLHVTTGKSMEKHGKAWKDMRSTEVHKEWRAGARLVIGGLQSSNLTWHRSNAIEVVDWWIVMDGNGISGETLMVVACKGERLSWA